MKTGAPKGETIMTQWAWAIFALLLSANMVAGAENLLDKRVRRFIFHGKPYERTFAELSATPEGIRPLWDDRSGPIDIPSDHLINTYPTGLPEAFRNLAHHAGVPIGIEALPAGMVGKVVPIEVDARNKTVGEILEQMVWQDRRYIYRERLGVIEVLPADAELDPANCLNMLIPKLIIADLDWDQTFESLLCQIDRVSRSMDLLPDPLRAWGCPGGSRVGHNGPPGMIQATFENERVRDILGKLSAMAEDVAWDARFEGIRTACEDLSLNSYRPRQRHPTDDGSTFSAEFPKECLACHYHSSP